MEGKIKTIGMLRAWKWNPRLLVAFFCLGAIFLGLVFAYQRSITLDEATTLFLSYRAFHFNPAAVLSDIHTSAYNSLLGIWLWILGFGLLQAKSFSIAAALAAVLVTYVLAKHYFNERVALYAALILSVSPVHVFYSQHARAYALSIAMATLSSYFYLAFERQRTVKSSIGYVIATYIMLCSHIATFCVLATQWVHFLLPALWNRKFKDVRLWLLVQTILAGLYAPIVYLVLHRFDLREAIPRIYAWVEKPTFISVLRSFSFLSGASLPLTGILWVLVGSVVLPFVLRLKNYRLEQEIRGSTSRHMSYLSLWLVLPAGIFLLYSFIHHPVPFNRGIVSSIIPLVILASLGLSHVRVSRALRWGTLSCIVLFSCFQTVRSRDLDEEPHRVVAQMVQKSGAAVLFVHPRYLLLPVIFYLQPGCFFSSQIEDYLNPHCSYPERGDAIHSYAVDSLQEIESVLRPGRQAWLLGYAAESQGLIQALKGDPRIHFKGSAEELNGYELWNFSSTGARP